MDIKFELPSINQLEAWEEKQDTKDIFEKASTKLLKEKYDKKQQDRHNQNKAEKDLPDWFK